jgi:hypothetical protein
LRPVTMGTQTAAVTEAFQAYSKKGTWNTTCKYEVTECLDLPRLRSVTIGT